MEQPKPKPPLGLRPRWVADEARFCEIHSAIGRYIEARKAVPREWLEEMIELHGRVFGERD